MTLIERISNFRGIFWYSREWKMFGVQCKTEECECCPLNEKIGICLGYGKKCTEVFQTYPLLAYCVHIKGIS